METITQVQRLEPPRAENAQKKKVDGSLLTYQ
jgi:hypothetical protein